MRPATVVDDQVIFEDGAGRTLTEQELELLAKGELETVPRGDARHETIPGPPWWYDQP